MRSRHSRILTVAVFLFAVTQALAQAPRAAGRDLWSDPGDIRAKDLFYGPGGKDGQPKPPFRFEKEDTHGTSPKFDVTDANGEKWRVKLGPEARPEPVASRLLWAVGYFANTNYFFPALHVDDMLDLTRPSPDIHPGGNITQARLQRKPGKREQTWNWRHNPFVGTREFNGLRAMMALLHNWDLKDDNNGRFTDKKTGREIYYVSDVGASIGTTGDSYTAALAKDNLKAYRSAKFISKVTPEYVDFNFPTHPALIKIFNPPLFYHEIRSRWIGRKIPRADVRWIASLLSQLSRQQIEDAFRAGGYKPDQVEALTAVVQQRIADLSKL